MYGLVAALALLVAPTAPSFPSAADSEEQLIAELERVAPEALEFASLAGEAYRTRRWEAAIAFYDRVLEVAPDFAPALRRVCSAQIALRRDGSEYCRRAVVADPRPENKIAYARALMLGRSPGAQAEQAAIRLATEALAETADRPEPEIARVACQVAAQRGEPGRALLRACVKVLVDTVPLSPQAHAYAAILRASEGDRAAARAELEASRAAGLDLVELAVLARFLGEEVPGMEKPSVDAGRLLPRLATVLLGWLAGLLGLLVAGAALSWTTSQVAARFAADRSATAPSGSRLLRRIYAAVLWVSCAYYFLSLPIVVVMLVALGAGILRVVASFGVLPGSFAVFVGLAVIVAVWATLKGAWIGIFRRPDVAEPGVRLAPGEHPALDALVKAVAARVKTRPVDAVFLVPGTTAAVFERGGMLRQLAGRTERCLVLGVGLLEGMTQGELSAIVAHEYGHLVNRDTGGGGFALAARRSMEAMARALVAGGASVLNPAWWFVSGFHRLFQRISLGASRLQEALADRWAALAYGGRALGRALTHIVERDVRFRGHVEQSIAEVVQRGIALVNVYRYAPALQEDAEAIAADIARAMARTASAYDSHPCPHDRIACTASIPGSTGIDGQSPAWALFSDREAVERTMTDRIRDHAAAELGVYIRGATRGAGRERGTGS